MRIGDFLLRITDKHYEDKPHGRILRAMDANWAFYVIHKESGVFMPASQGTTMLDVIQHVSKEYPDARLVDFIWTANSQEALDALIERRGEPPTDDNGIYEWCKKVAGA